MFLLLKNVSCLLKAYQDARQRFAFDYNINLCTNNFEFKEGPSLMEKRFSASAAKMNFNGKTFIAIAGGYGGNGRIILDSDSDSDSDSVELGRGNILDSVELLDVSSPGQSWIEGKNNQITINFLNTILYTIQIFII